VEFKCTQAPTNDPKTQQVTSVGHIGRGGGSCSCQSGRGQGQRTGNARQKGLVPQAEIGKQTHITLRDYFHDEYKQLTPAKGQKLWQLRNPGKTPGTGLIRGDRNVSVALTSTNTYELGKCQVEDSAAKDDKPADDPAWGRNPNIPAVGH
jgi:hypothetical protein